MTKHVPITKKIRNQRDTDIQRVCNELVDAGHKPKIVYKMIHNISGLSEEYVRQLHYAKLTDTLDLVKNEN